MKINCLDKSLLQMDSLFLKRFTVNFLNHILKLDLNLFVDIADIDSLHNLLSLVIPDYYAYTNEIVSKLAKVFPKEFNPIKEQVVRIYKINSIIDEDIRYFRRKDCWKIIVETTEDYLKQINFDTITDKNTYTSAEKKLEKYLGLSKQQIKLITTFYIFSQNRYYEDLIREFDLDSKKNLHKLCECLDVTVTDYLNSLDELENAGIIAIHQHIPKPNYSIIKLYDPYKNTDPAEWYDTLKGDLIPLENFQIEKSNLNLLQKMLNKDFMKPVNILFYGEPGSGKTTLVSSLAKELGIKVFNVRSGLKDDDSDRRLSLYTCVNLANKFKGNSVVLVDEAERLLYTSLTSENKKDKAWLNTFLEEKKVSIIWITNQISYIDQAVRRRFDFSLYFPLLSKKQRLVLWDNILKKYEATSLISRSSLSNLNEKYVVPVSIIDRSVEYARNLSSDKKEFSSLIKTQLDAYLSLKFDGIDTKELLNNSKKLHLPNNHKLLTYTPDGVNFDCDIEKFTNGVKRMDSYIRNSKNPKSGCGTMLFYGPSGTGKTELARYIAKITKRTAVIKKASDILNCYVGMNEKNIATTFNNLNLKKEILIIDEVDSFLFNRANASHSWESSLVNEFLTQLQDFKGMLICTTNLIDGLDPAVMRRFSFKLAFRYSDEKQSVALFNSILKPISGQELSSDEQKELQSMKNLTPGDFHVVEDKYCSFFTVSGKASNSELLSALREELKLKKASIENRRIGFI